MKNKALVLLLILTMICSIFALVACKDPNETPSGDIPSGVGSGDSSDKDEEQNQEHTHTYATTWTNDETYHWHASTCGHDVTKDKAEHSWDNDYICKICNYDNSNGLLFEINSDNTAYTVKGIKEGNTSTDIVIPSRYKGIPVTNIGSSAFYDCRSLTSIEIPSSVTSIGSDAFYNCNNLTIYCEAASKPSGWHGWWNNSNRPVVWNFAEHGETESGIMWGLTKGGTITICGYSGESTQVVIPETINGHSVTSIADSAFYGCSSLTSIEIPSGVTSIGSCAFRGCSSLTSIEIPSSVTSIGDGVFGYCSSLTSIEIPSSVTSIGSCAFRDCRSLTSIEIPSSVTSIGEYAFSGCSSLTSIVIPSGVTSIGSSAFYGCSSLRSIEIPEVVKSIGSDAFDGCSNITTATIPTIAIGYIPKSKLEKVIINAGTSIGDSAFSGCSSLTSIVIPNSVTSIGNYAFSGCNRLAGIEIPSSVTSIGSSAFSGCRSLTIYCQAESQPSGWDSSWNYINRPVVWGYKG